MAKMESTEDKWAPNPPTPGLTPFFRELARDEALATVSVSLPCTSCQMIRDFPNRSRV